MKRDAEGNLDGQILNEITETRRVCQVHLTGDFWSSVDLNWLRREGNAADGTWPRRAQWCSIFRMRLCGKSEALGCVHEPQVNRHPFGDPGRRPPRSSRGCPRCRTLAAEAEHHTPRSDLACKQSVVGEAYQTLESRKRPAKPKTCQCQRRHGKRVCFDS